MKRKIQLFSWDSRSKVMLSGVFFYLFNDSEFSVCGKSWCPRRKCCSTGSNFSEAVH